MGHLPTGEVSLYQVMEWAQEQTKFLTPTSSLVLWYLCINAFRTYENPEDREPGDVLSGRAQVADIQRGTGLSRSTVQRALDALQDAGYVIAQHVKGNGHSRVSVFWSEPYDRFREDFREGIKPLPNQFKRASKPVLAVVKKDAVVIPFKARS